MCVEEGAQKGVSQPFDSPQVPSHGRLIRQEVGVGASSTAWG